MNKRPYQIMTHIVAGYPTLAESEAIALAMIETEIDYLEIQIPFTDPVADGPVISAANHISLDNGTAVQDCMNLMKSLRAKTDIPLYFMTYYNIPFVYGLERFCAEAKSAGATGIICPDMPYDEEKRNGYFAQCQKYNLQAILVVSPLTSEERLKHIGEVSKGVIYCVAGSGTTGAERTFDSEMKKYLDRVRQYTHLPLALGFGIRTREQMDAVGQMADIVVIGSQVIREYEEGGIEAVKKLFH